MSEATKGCAVPHRLDELEFGGCAACAWREFHKMREEAERLQKRIAQMECAIAWACGLPVEKVEDFGSMTHDLRAKYWWRPHLVRIAGLSYDALLKYQREVPR